MADNNKTGDSETVGRVRGEFKADRKTLKLIGKIVLGIATAVGGGAGVVKGYEAMRADMQAAITAAGQQASDATATAIKAAAPDKQVITELRDATMNMQGDLRGIRGDMNRDREEYRNNHIQARGELQVLKGEIDALERVVQDMKASGVNPNTIERFDDRLRAVEQRIAAIEARMPK
jgi:TolA-binding protein